MFTDKLIQFFLTCDLFKRVILNGGESRREIKEAIVLTTNNQTLRISPNLVLENGRPVNEYRLQAQNEREERLNELNLVYRLIGMASNNEIDILEYWEM